MLEARYRLAGDNVRAYADKRREDMDRRKLGSRQLIGTADDENKNRGLCTGSRTVAIGTDNAEKALAFYFDAVTKSVTPASAESPALLKRVITVHMDYARKVALANDLSEATALQFAFCRSQVEIATEHIRVVSDSAN